MEKVEYIMSYLVVLFCVLSIIFIPLYFINFNDTTISNTPICGSSKNNNWTNKCNCTFENYDNIVCENEKVFISSNFYMTLCHEKSDMIIHFKQSEKFAAFYTRAELEKLHEFLSMCMDKSGFGCNIVKKTGLNITKDRNSLSCRYYTSFENLLSLCFGINKYLSRAFVNKTVFTSSDISTFYSII